MAERNNNNEAAGAVARPQRNNNININNRIRGPRRQRAQNFRAVAGGGELQAFAARRDDNLFEGFGSLQNYVDASGTVIVPNVRDLCITTRGIGGMVRRLYDRVELNLTNARMGGLTVHMLYRCALMHFECKISQAYKRQFEHRSNEQQMGHNMIPMEQERIILNNPQMFTPISGIINQVGNVKFNNNTYHVGMLDDIDMLNLRFSNLRESVTHFSDLETPAGERNLANQWNAIPGAIFEEVEVEDVPNSFVLMNPDVIIPDPYGAAEMQEDFRRLHVCMDNCARRIPQYVGGTMFNDIGSASILLSTEIATNPSIWWSPELLNPSQATIGAIGKFGEVYPNYEEMVGAIHTRSPFTSIMTCDVIHEVAVNGLLG